MNAANERQLKQPSRPHLRRVDWRFLLPSPRATTSICFTDQHLAQAVAAISDNVIEPVTHPTDTCDLAVAQNPSQQTLQTIWKALLPGGVCYLESDSYFHSALRWRQILEQLGFVGIVCYWPWPNRIKTAYWLPLEASHIVEYILAKRAANRLSKIWNHIMSHLLRWQLFRRMFPHMSIIAYKPPISLDGVLDIVRANWYQWSPTTSPRQLTWMLLTGGAHDINKVVGLIFVNAESYPDLVVKMARIQQAAEAIDHEVKNLRVVHDLHPSMGASIPRVLFSQPWAGQTIVGETALAGQPFYKSLRRENSYALAMKVTRWLATLLNNSTALPPSAWWSRLIEPILENFERNFGPILDPNQVNEARLRLATLPNLPAVCEQRDCSPWNILIDDKGNLVLLDWESAQPDGFPLLDLVYFLTYTIFFLDGAMNSHRFIESYRQALDRHTFTGGLVADCQSRYLASLSLGSNVAHPLRLLTWMVHSRSEYARLVAKSGPPTLAELKGSLFVQLWQEELVHGMVQ